MLVLGGCLPELTIPIVADDPAHDFDGDGLSESQGDCDDVDPSVGPNADELRELGGSRVTPTWFNR